MAFDAKTNWKYDDPVMEDDFNRWEKGIKDAHNLVDAIGTDLTTFKKRRDNPHAVTKAQVGLGNVDNVKQASKDEFDTHDTDNIRHVTATERTKWNAAEENALDWVKSFGIGTDRAIYLRDDDLNVVREGGLYYVGANTVNKPVTDNGYLLVLPYTSTYTAQIYLTNGKGNMYTRVSTNVGSTWEAWKTLETTAGAQAKVNAHANLKNNPHEVTSEQVSLTSYRPATDSGDLYPIGFTMFFIGADDTGYPTTHGIVVNMKYNSTRFTQWYFSHGGGGHATVGNAQFRHWYTGVGWSQWYRVETTEGAQDKADKALMDAKTYADGKSSLFTSDTRDVNDPPSKYSRQLFFEFKRLTAIGLSAAGTYCTVITDGRWTGSSGGRKNQIALTDNGKMFMRLGSADESSWGSWVEMETTAGAQTKANKALSDAQAYSMNQVAVGSTADPNTTQEAYILTNHANSPGGGIYWHIHTFFYSSKTGNRSQTAVSYSGSTPRMMIRHMYGGTWSPWEELSKEGHKHVWADITDVGNASTSTRGIVQLSTATNSTSTTLAATPSAVKSAYDLAAGRETLSGAQAKANAAEANAKSYINSKIQSGMGTQKVPPNTVGTGKIVFPKAFAKTPNVVVSLVSGRPDTRSITLWDSDLNTTGCTVYLWNGSNSELDFRYYWVAHEQ
ncbi:MAG TPA: hypothetical protein DEO65_04350 [Bacillus bacterium]|nr:hypothetical protein [Bacillus sp. (in: firmicutes)]